MTLEELLSALQVIKDEVDRREYDAEHAHFAADQLLVAYIDNEQVADLYGEIPKWYS